MPPDDRQLLGELESVLGEDGIFVGFRAVLRGYSHCQEILARNGIEQVDEILLHIAVEVVRIGELDRVHVDADDQIVADPVAERCPERDGGLIAPLNLVMLDAEVVGTVDRPRRARGRVIAIGAIAGCCR